MLPHINIFNLIFLDIETVPAFASHSELSEAMKNLWAIKHSQLRIEGETPEEGYLKRAGVYAEFAKIICITLGYFYYDKEVQLRQLRLKTFKGDNEGELLNEFMGIIKKGANDPERFRFCGHNIREFDIPFICRRALINNIDLPDMLDISGKRPWDTYDVDTMQLWKFGDYKHFTSLKLLAEILGIPTPKDDIDGKDVCRVYWVEKNLERIATYCQKDVATVARLLLRFKGDPTPLQDNHITLVP